MPKCSVVYVITTTGFGGAERQVLELASAMRSRGWGVAVVSMVDMHEQFFPLESRGVRLASLGMTEGVPDLRGLIRFARLLEAWRPSVVHGHMVHGIFLARLSRVLAPVPKVVSTMHSQEQGPQWRYYVFRLTDPLTDMTTAVSRMAVDEAVRRHAVRRENIVLVPNGIRTEQYEVDAALRQSTRSALHLGDRFTWLAVGHLKPVKRHTDLLAAVRVVREADPDCRVLIAGGGNLRAALEDEIRDSGLASNVSLLGLRQDIRALMQAADGFVMSSAWEGLPMALLEASASSLPSVVTDVGGSRDVISDGETGFLSPALEPSGLAASMLRLMALPASERTAMGARARARVVQTFDMERVADRWEELYRRR